MLRVVVAAPGPNFSVADVHMGWMEGLREAGAHVVDFNLDRRLDFYSQAMLPTGPHGAPEAALTTDQAIDLALNGLLACCYRVRPHLLLVISGFFMAPDVLAIVRSHGTRVVMVHTESPYEDDRQVLRAAHCDANVINDPTNLESFRAACPSTWYVPHAYRPSVHYPRDLSAVRDLVFVGTGYPSRIDWLERVDWSRMDSPMLAGNWQALSPDSPLLPLVAHDLDECLDNADTAGLYATSRMSLNLYRREADRPELSDGWAMGPREVELAATGVFFLRDPRGESDEMLPMLPALGEPEELADQVSWWAAHDTERHEAADKARAAVADRTFVNNARWLLGQLDMH